MPNWIFPRTAAFVLIFALDVDLDLGGFFPTHTPRLSLHGNWDSDFLSPFLAVCFEYPFVSILSQHHRQVEISFYIWMLSSNN